MKILLCRFSIYFILILFINTANGQVSKKLDSLQLAFEKSNDDQQKMRILFSLSNEYMGNDLSMALQYGQRANELALKTKDNAFITSSMMHLGYIYFQIGMLDQSAKYYSDCMYYEKKSGNKLSEANVWTNLASIHLKMEELDKGKEFLMNALQIYEHYHSENPDSLPLQQLATVYNNLGIIAQNQKDYPLAYEYYNRGIANANILEANERVLAMLYNNIGLTYLDQLRADEALTAFQKALNIRLLLNDQHGIASSYRNLSLYFKQKTLPDSALKYLRKAMAVAKQVGDNYIISNIASNAFEIYNDQQKADSALKYLLVVQQIDDIIKKEETSKALTHVELTAQFMEKERLQKEAQMRKDLWITFFGIFLLLAFIILGLLYFLSRSRIRRLHLEKDVMELEAKNLELEKTTLQKELEIKNKELTTNVMYQIRKNELICEIAQNLQKHSSNFKKENQELILNIIRDLEKSQEQSLWSEFEMRFQSVHNDFYENLNIKHPDLSPNERKLCAFLKLNMSTKEIASITGQTPRSIEVARTRLRKKLNLTNREDNLIEYLSSF